MYSLDISDTSIELVQLRKNLRGKPQIRSALRVEVGAGEKWSGKLPPEVLGKKIAYTIPDTKVFLHRFSFPADVSLGTLEVNLLEGARELIPEPLENLVYTYQNLSLVPEQSRDVLLIAVHKETLSAYGVVWQSARISPTLAIPESLAIFEILKKTLTPKEYFLYVDIGAKYSSLSFFDGLGPHLTLAEPVETTRLESETRKAIDYFERKHGQKLERVLLGGGGSLTVDPKEFQRAVGAITTLGEKVLEDYLDQNKIKFEQPDSPKILFLGAIGLGLLSLREKEYALNLLNGKAYSEEAVERRVMRKKTLPDEEPPFIIRKLTNIIFKLPQGLLRKIVTVFIVLTLVLGLILVVRAGRIFPFQGTTPQPSPTLPKQPPEPTLTVSEVEKSPKVEASPTDITPTVTATPIPTSTPAPTLTPTPENLLGKVISKRGINLRSGPGTDYEIVGHFSLDDQVIIIGENEEGTWLKVRSVDGEETGWVSATNIEI